MSGATVYAYANGNPISHRDPLGLWSFSFSGYAGFGGAIEFGQDEDTGAWFYGGRLGIGFDVGWSLDPNGKRPGAEQTGSCGPSTTVGTFGSAGINVGPLQWALEEFGGGIDLNSGKTYSEGPNLGSPTITFGSGESVEIGASIGIEVVGHN